MKTSTRARERNRAARSALRRSLRLYREGDHENPEDAYKSLQSILDRAVNKGIISRNKAARLKSRQAPTG
jgi:small subunit ribosomal protein S20